MIDPGFIGKTYAEHSVYVEKGQLKFFAKVVGIDSPVYTDEDEAKAAGYRSILAPPTFAFSLDLARPNQFLHIEEMGVDMKQVLHGGQRFEYLGPIFAGDTIKFRSAITDVYSKKGGALNFFETETIVSNQFDEVVVKMFATTVVRG